MEEYSGYVGLDVHKETISPALANPGRSKPESLGVIANTKKSVLNLVVLPPLSVGEMTLRPYGALSYSQNSADDLRCAPNGA